MSDFTSLLFDLAEETMFSEPNIKEERVLQLVNAFSFLSFFLLIHLTTFFSVQCVRSSISDDYKACKSWIHDQADGFHLLWLNPAAPAWKRGDHFTRFQHTYSFFSCYKRFRSMCTVCVWETAMAEKRVLAEAELPATLFYWRIFVRGRRKSSPKLVVWFEPQMNEF